MSTSIDLSATEQSGDGYARAYVPGPRDTIVDALRRAVEANGDDEFVNVNGARFSYAEIDLLSNRLAHGLADLGVKKGDTVVTIFDTSPDVIVTWFAICKLGGIWVPINTAYTGEFLRHQISDSKARLVICDERYIDRVVTLADALITVEKILSRGAGPYPQCRIPIDAFDSYRGDDDRPLPKVVEPADLACLLYTSGTTGPSKGCMISHNYMCMQGRQQMRAMPQSRDEVGWSPLPLFHAAALILVLGGLVGRARVALWSRFSVSRFWDDLEEAGATHCLLMASIFPLVAFAPTTEAMERWRGKVRMISGVPITAEVRKIWTERFGVEIVSSWSYGQTEGTRLCMVLPHETPPEDSAGRVSDEFELRIVDDTDCPVEDGQIGEIVYRPREPNVMFEGYWGRPADTALAWRNLWMHSGDLGRMVDGYLYFCDRAKDYLRSRGENISSFEVERTFTDHPAVKEVAVHACGPTTGEDEIKATIVLQDDATITEQDLCEWSIERLPHFAVPRFFEFRAEIYKNPTGKVLKYKLRDEGLTPQTWDREEAGIIVRRR